MNNWYDAVFLNKQNNPIPINLQKNQMPPQDYILDSINNDYFNLALTKKYNKTYDDFIDIIYITSEYGCDTVRPYGILDGETFNLHNVTLQNDYFYYFTNKQILITFNFKHNKKINVSLFYFNKEHNIKNIKNIEDNLKYIKHWKVAQDILKNLTTKFISI